MSQETLLKVWQAMNLIGEVKEESRKDRTLRTAVHDAEMALTIALRAAAHSLSVTSTVAR